MVDTSSRQLIFIAAAFWVAVVCSLPGVYCQENLFSESIRTSNDSNKTLIYSDGLAPGWTVLSYGVPVLNTNDSTIRRYGSSACIYAEAFPFGSLAFQSLVPFIATSVLDLWLRGTVLTNARLLLEDSLGLRTSHALSLQDAGTNTNISLKVGPDADGWVRLYINLQELTQGTSTPPSTPTSFWNRIVFKDASGSGFDFAMDDSAILPGVAPSNTSSSTEHMLCVGSVCSSDIEPASLESELVPLLGGNIRISAVDGPIKLLARVAPGITASNVTNLCAELQGSVPIAGTNTSENAGSSGQRFQGSCTAVQIQQAWPSKDRVQAADAQGVWEAEENDAWPLFSLTASSQADLYAMRAALKDSIAFFEYDGTVTTIPVASVYDEYAATTLEGSAGAAGNVSAAATCSGAVPWGLDRVDQDNLPLNGVYNPGVLNGAGVHIYIIDTGLYAATTELTGRIGLGANCVSGTCTAGGNTNDGNGHGTHVSGTAAGSCYGVAKGAIVHPIKALGDDGAGGFSGIVAGMRWAKSHIQANGWRGVVGMSLGGSFSQSINDAVQELVSAGVTVVAAAGNEQGADSCTKSPGSAPAAITVGATDSSDRRASYSNIGRCLDIWAPGSAIKSAGIASPGATATLSGTSMATPHVSGAAAVLLQPGGYGLTTPAQVADFMARASVKRNLESSSSQNFLQVDCASVCGAFAASGWPKCTCG